MDRPIELTTPEFHTLEELLVDLGAPLIIDGTRTSDRIVAAINNPASHYLASTTDAVDQLEVQAGDIGRPYRSHT